MYSKSFLLLKEIFKKPNLKEIYKLIRSHGVLEKKELVVMTGIKSGKINIMLEELLNSNIIITAGLGESTGGRRPILYKINPAYAYIIGLDFSRKYSRLVISDLNMNIIEQKKWAMTIKMEPTYLFNCITSYLDKVFNSQIVLKENILGMGIGTVGPLDSEKKIILDSFEFPAPGWKDVEVYEYFFKKMKMPVYMDIGGSTALRGEYRTSFPHNDKNIVYFHIDRGLRSSIMTNGKIVSGSIGQMIIESDGISPQNPYGNYGALHSYVTISYIIKKIKSRLKQGRISILNNLINNVEELNFSHLLQALNKDDFLTTEVFIESATYLGIGLSNLINILHPEKIILGGPLITSQNIYYETAINVAKNKTYKYYPTNTSFAKAQLGENGVALGAAMMVLDSFFE